MENRLKCKYCDWTTPTALSVRDGHLKGAEPAQNRLRDHVIDQHPEVFDDIQSRLEDSNFNDIK